MNSILKLITDNMNNIVKFIIVALVGFIFIKILMFIFNKSKVIEKIDPTVSGFLSGLIKFLLYASYIIIILGVLGVPITTFIAMISAVGLAIALALQGNLANFAGAIMILISKPFIVGEYIECDKNSGTVTEIKMLFTQIMTVDNRKIIIPNSKIVNSSIINYTSENIRRIDLVFSASYDSTVEKVKKVLNEIAKNHDKILSEPEPLIRLIKHGDNALDYDFKVWVDTNDFWPVLYDLQETVREKFEENEIEIPFPQRDIYIKYPEKNSNGPKQ